MIASGPFSAAVKADGLIYVSGTLKWLFGGSGTAFAWVRPALHEALVPTTTGWFSSARQFDFAVDDLDAEYARLSGLGVRFTQEPTPMGPVTTAVLDDTCGNLIQIATVPE